MLILYIKIILVMVFWGSAFVSGRMLALSYPPIVVAFLRFLVACAFLFPWLYYKEKKVWASKLSHYGIFAMLGLFGVFLYNYTFLSGLKLVEAGRSSVIISFNPVASAVISVLFLKERLNRLQLLGVGFGLMGVLYVLSRGDLSSLITHGVDLGEMYLLIAVASWITYTILGRKYMRGITAIQGISWTCLFGLLYLMPFALSSGLIDAFFNLNTLDIINLINLGFFSTCLGFIWYYEAVLELGVAKTTSFINLLPLVGVLTGILFLGEQPTMTLYLGGALTLVGVFIVNRFK